MTLLIKNVQIVGGVREYPDTCDVFVSDDRISAIGNFPSKTADTIIDGQGAYLSPGFIDVNTDSDHYLTLFDHPSQEDFLKQGVTTMLGGMCGASLAPLPYGSLESFKKWGDINRINVNWHTVAEFLAVLDKRPLALNFGTFAGHSTIRRALAGEALRDLTKNEINVFGGTLETALKEGAFGLSSGLSSVHARKTPFSELHAFADIVKKYNGVYATHLRATAMGIKDAVDETIKLANDSGVSTEISHFLPVIGAEEEYETALATIEHLPEEIKLRFDVYPSLSSLVPLYTFLPEWAQNGGIDVMTANVKDEWLLQRIKKETAPINEKNFVIAQAPGNDFLVGKSLVDLQKMYETKDAMDALFKLMATIGLKASVIYKNLNNQLMMRALASKRSFIASNAPSFGKEQGRRQLKSERTTSTYTTFLSLVENEKILPLEEAIRKITIEPALTFGIAGRGQIKEGNFADLVCFKGSDIKFTIVNGVVVERENEFQQTYPGKALRHSFSKQ